MKKKDVAVIPKAKVKPKKKIVKKVTKAIAIRSEIKSIEVVTKEKISEYLKAFNMTTLTNQEQMQFIEIATAFQLNPFKKEIYCVPYMKSIKNDVSGQWEKQRSLSIITGYEVYLKRAERTGRLNGWKCETEGEGANMRAIATIHRKDWQYPFTHEVFLSEVGQYDDKGVLRSMWKKMTKFMLKKVCMAQAFRLCFPDELGGMPYIADEMPANMTDVSYIELPKASEFLKEQLQTQELEDAKKKEQAEMFEVLKNLPDDIKQGFKLLGYADKKDSGKAAYLFCKGHKFDNEKILAHLKLLADKP